MTTDLNDKAKQQRLRRTLAAVVELTAAMSADWCAEYPRYIAGELEDDPHAFAALMVMRHKMVETGGDAQSLLAAVGIVDKKFADAQYKKLLRARDNVMVHDTHFKAEGERLAEEFQREQKVEH